MIDADKKILLNIINNKIKLENGCHIWNGCISKEDDECIIQFKYKRYYVHTTIWNINNLDKQIKKNEQCIRTCGNKRCVFLDHLSVVQRAKTPTKKEIWERLVQKGKKLDNGCFLWTGYCCPDGYGQTSVKINNKHKTYKVHRLSYWVSNDIKLMPTKNETDAFLIRHLCGNRKCFEPTHLRLGSNIENAADKNLHGTCLKGEKHPNSKIDFETAKKIKLSKPTCKKNSADYKTQKQRSEFFGVNRTIIESIDKGTSWADIPNHRGEPTVPKQKQYKKRQTTTNVEQWTEETFLLAEKILLSRTTLTKEILRPFVNSPCRVMTNKPPKKGYPSISVFGKRHTTHILACEIKNRKRKPDELITRHICGNKLCCNSDHLVFGTNSENMNDKFIHGTSNAKLTPEIVREIRQTLGKDGLSRKERAKKYGTTFSNMKNIELGYTWKNIQ